MHAVFIERALTNTEDTMAQIASLLWPEQTVYTSYVLTINGVAGGQRFHDRDEAIRHFEDTIAANGHVRCEITLIRQDTFKGITKRCRVTSACTVVRADSPTKWIAA